MSPFRHLHLYVIRLSSSVSKLWEFHREFTCSLRICPLFKKNEHEPKGTTIEFSISSSDLLPATPGTSAASPTFYPPSLRSIVNAIQFRRRENEGGIDRRMKFDILPDAAWKRAENRARWHVGNHSNRFRAFRYTITNIIRKFLKSFFTHILPQCARISIFGGLLKYGANNRI